MTAAERAARFRKLTDLLSDADVSVAFEDPAERWTRLTQSLLRTLVDALDAGPEESDWDRWTHSLERWDRYPEVNRRQLAAAQWCVWCARQALRPVALDGALAALRNSPVDGAPRLPPPESLGEGGSSNGASWIRSTVAWFHEQRAKPRDTTERASLPRSVRIPVALFDETRDKGERGYLATLIVEVVDRGGWFVARHPEDVFVPEPAADFCLALDDAFDGACRLVEPDSDRQRGARWRLQDRRTSKPVPRPAGRSASGAASLAFWHALHDPVKYPDALLVLAQVSKADHAVLESVAEIEEKAGAVREHKASASESAADAIDTIVVATAEDQKAAEDVLREQFGPESPIRVVLL